MYVPVKGGLLMNGFLVSLLVSYYGKKKTILGGFGFKFSYIFIYITRASWACSLNYFQHKSLKFGARNQ